MEDKRCVWFRGVVWLTGWLAGWSAKKRGVHYPLHVGSRREEYAALADARSVRVASHEMLQLDKLNQRQSWSGQFPRFGPLQFEFRKGLLRLSGLSNWGMRVH